MVESSRNNAGKTAARGRGRPFEKGNPGRPRGARHRATLAAATLLDGEAEALSRKAIELALDGDTVALKLCLDRILPPRRERDVVVNLPSFRSPGDAGEVSAVVLEAVSKGEVTLREAAELAKLIADHVAMLERSEKYKNSASIFPELSSFLRRRMRSEADN
jgi:hypothetical protein